MQNQPFCRTVLILLSQSAERDRSAEWLYRSAEWSYHYTERSLHIVVMWCHICRRGSVVFVSALVCGLVVPRTPSTYLPVTEINQSAEKIRPRATTTKTTKVVNVITTVVDHSAERFTGRPILQIGRPFCRMDRSALGC